MILSFSHVTFSVGHASRRRRVLHDVSFSLSRGEIVALVGPSGEGKTTVINLATGLLTPDEGIIDTLGVEVSSAPDMNVSRLRAQRIGVVFQSFHLLPRESALENVLLPAYFGARPAYDMRERAATLRERAGLEGWRDVAAIELSEGQRQRVAIARALLQGPELVLADEPTGNLDDVAALKVLRLLIDEVRRENGTLLIATHDQRCLGLVDKTLVLRQGRIGTPDTPEA